MVAIDTSRSDLAVTAGRFGAAILSVINAVVDWNDARLTRKALNGLTDRELDDIGLVRGDIDAIVAR